MSTVRGASKRAIPIRSPYICPRCQYRQFSFTIQTQYTASVTPGRRREILCKFVSVRRLSTTPRPCSIEADAINLPSSPPLPLPPPSSSKGYIRDQLRVWSVENQKKVLEAAKDGISPVRGRKIEIPQNLWLDEDVDEAAEDDEDLDIEEFEHRRHALSEVNTRDTRVLPGDIILLSADVNTRTLVLCLAKVGESAFWLHMNGKWSTTPWRSGDLKSTLGTTIHSFATEEEIAPILEWLPKKALYDELPSGAQKTKKLTGELPSRVTQPLVQRLKGLNEKMKAFRRSHLTSHDRLYAQIASEDEYIRVGFEKLISTTFGLDFNSLDDAGRLSVFLLINQDPIKMVLLQLSSESELSVMIVPKRTARNNAEIIKWSRRYQQAAADASKGHNVREALAGNPLTSFIDKARRIILKSRRIRSPTTLGYLGPSNEASKHDLAGARESSGEEFSDRDKMVIAFIWDAIFRQPQPKQKNKHHAVASLILRAVGAYPKMNLDAKIGRLFLQELGAVAPWTEGRETNVTLPTPGQRGQAGEILDRHRNSVLEMSKDWPLSRDEGPLPVIDTMAHLRKDLGDLPVLCIDRASARIIDDGISLESCEEQPGTWWIHVHIAHPSAFFDPDHPVGQAGRTMGATMYASGSSIFMIDARIGIHLSLAPGAEAFTVSTLLNDNGEVLEIKVAATRVNNVVRLRSEVVRTLMKYEHDPVAIMVVGPDSRITADDWEDPGSEEALQAAKKHLPMMNRMRTLLDSRYRQRQKEVPVAADHWANDFAHRVSVSWEEPNDRHRLDRSFHYLSDPTIKLVASQAPRVRRISDRDLSNDIVTHAMWLCGESFGKWMSDRNIPAVFHGASTATGFPVSKLNSASRDTRLMLPSPDVQAEPRPHVLMNMQQFCRITSPLRRYPDLIAQWNADAYLRAEAEGRVKPGASAKDIDFPMPKRAIQEYLKGDFWVIKYSEYQGIMAYSHWGFQAFFRAFHFKEAVLPEVWDVQVSTSVVRKDRLAEASGLTGNLIPFKLRAFILISKEGYEQRAIAGKYLPCKIELVDVTETYLAMRPVGEATDEPQFAWKEHIVTPKEKRIAQRSGEADLGEPRAR